MAIYARRNLIITQFGPNVILTQPLQAGQTLVYDSAIGSFVNETGGGADSGAVKLVADIPSRDALAPELGPGALVFVQDNGTGDHTYALYMWNGASFQLISTQDSANTDADSVEVSLDYNSPAQILLATISPGHRVVDISINVSTPFDGTPSITVGDDINGASSLMPASVVDLTTAGDYFIDAGDIVYTGTQVTQIKAYYNPNGATVGHAEIIISYV